MYRVWTSKYIVFCYEGLAHPRNIFLAQVFLLDYKLFFYATVTVVCSQFDKVMECELEFRLNGDGDFCICNSVVVTQN